MILGRPANQWIGLVTAAASLLQVLLITLVPTVDPVNVGIVIGAVTAFLGILIAFIANQPPSINVGDGYTVVTPGAAPNVEKVANAFPTPPANLVAK